MGLTWLNWNGIFRRILFRSCFKCLRRYVQYSSIERQWEKLLNTLLTLTKGNKLSACPTILIRTMGGEFFLNRSTLLHDGGCDGVGWLKHFHLIGGRFQLPRGEGRLRLLLYVSHLSLLLLCALSLVKLRKITGFPSFSPHNKEAQKSRWTNCAAVESF